MSPEAMERSYQDDYAADAAHELAEEQAAEQAFVDAVYGDLEQEPDTLVRGWL